MNQKLLAEFRDTTREERIVIDYREVKDSKKLLEILGGGEELIQLLLDKPFYYCDEDDWVWDLYRPSFPHRLVTVDDFYREEEWTPKSGEEVEISSGELWLLCRHIGYLDGRYYCIDDIGNVWSSKHIRKPIPIISIEEAEAWMKENGREVKIKQ